MIVANNQWGISTPAVRAARARSTSPIAGKAFGMKTAVDRRQRRRGLYRELKRAMDYVRTERRPFLLEAHGLASLRALVGVRRELRPRGGRLPRRVREEARGAEDPHAHRDGRTPRALHAAAPRGEQARARGAAARGRGHPQARLRRARPRCGRRRRSRPRIDGATGGRGTGCTDGDAGPGHPPGAPRRRRAPRRDRRLRAGRRARRSAASSRRRRG